MRHVVLVVLATLGIAGCAAQAARDPAPAPAAPAASSQQSVPGDLRGTDWRFVEVEGLRVSDGVNATLRLREGRASGKAGCNSYGASWEITADGGTRFGETMSTRMACLEPTGAMQVERGVFNALQHATRLRRDGETLVMLDASGKPLAKLTPDNTP